MKILYRILAVFVVLVGALVAFAATKPDEMVITRSTQVNATPEKVFPLVNDFHNWTQWSPWDKLDPNLQRTYSGPAAGVGAKYEWTGNDEVGQGEMTITESTPLQRVVLDLHFITPFEATNVTEFVLNPKGAQTEVVWTMRGPSPFIMKVMGIVFNLDATVGKDFESGLAAMKAAAERP